MKELSIEEKVKRYDEALHKAKNYYSTTDSSSDIKLIGLIFPELKESEDERIRKKIIQLVNDAMATNAPYKKEMLAWLKKQGGQKPTQETEPTPIFRIGDVLKRKGRDYTFRVDRIQGGYYHCDRNHGAFFPIEEQGNWELVEQNPAWREEDESMLLSAIEYIQTYPAHRQSVVDWLKSLKDRYTWKPSDEQITWLYRATDEAKKDSRIKQVLNELLSDLKKLREE